jgi:hypothetical protein
MSKGVIDTGADKVGVGPTKRERARIQTKNSQGARAQTSERGDLRESLIASG